MSLDSGPSLADLYAAIAALETDVRRSVLRLALFFGACLAIVTVVGVIVVSSTVIREEQRIARNTRTAVVLTSDLTETQRVVRILQDEHDLGERRYGVLLNKLQLIGDEIALWKRHH